MEIVLWIVVLFIPFFMAFFAKVFFHVENDDASELVEKNTSNKIRRNPSILIIINSIMNILITIAIFVI